YTTGGIHHYTDGSRDTPDIMLGYFDYPDRNNTGAFTVQLGANYVDGVSKKWGSMDFRIVGSKGSLDVGWDKIVLKTTGDVNTKDFEALGELGQEFDAPRKVSSREYVFNAKKGYKGGHYDHHFNFFNGIRNNTPLTADVLFAVRTAAPALLSYESYLRNEAIKWDAQKLKIRK
ncbi:MAG: gfo/Idh/MocA family oxidoreductase, partial [Petrimonas mucosa]